jgi:uncharacterized protein (TIGR02145 family)
VGNKLKEAGTAHWSNDSGADNSSGFTALGGGFRQTYGGFIRLLNNGYFWSSSPSGGYAWYRRLNYYDADVLRNDDASLRNGFAVRCVGD